MPKKIADNSQRALAFQSLLLLEKNPYLRKGGHLKHDLFFLAASLPHSKFKRFLNYAVLSFLKNDRSLLINGSRLKKLNSFFSPHEMQFLIYEKQTIMHTKKRLILDNQFEINSSTFDDIAFLILKCLFSKNNVVLEFLKFRFSKETVFNEIYDFSDIIDSNSGEQFMDILLDSLFPQLVQTFKKENKIELSEKEMPPSNPGMSFSPSINFGNNKISSSNTVG